MSAELKFNPFLITLRQDEIKPNVLGWFACGNQGSSAVGRKTGEFIFWIQLFINAHSPSSANKIK